MGRAALFDLHILGFYDSVILHNFTVSEQNRTETGTLFGVSGVIFHSGHRESFLGTVAFDGLG